MSGREAPAPFLHASQHAPGGTDELANFRAAVRRQRLVTAMGLITETCQRGDYSGASAGIGGQVIGNPVYMFAGETLTDLILHVSAGGSGLTLYRVGYYNLAAQLVAASADVKASMTSVGEKDVPMATPFLVPTDDVYFPVFFGTGTTQPSILRLGGGAAGSGGPFGAGTAKMGVSMAGQVDLPATATFAVSGTLYWMGVR